MFCGVGKEHSLEFKDVRRAGIKPSPVEEKMAPEIMENHSVDAPLQLPSALLASAGNAENLGEP